MNKIISHVAVAIVSGGAGAYISSILLRKKFEAEYRQSEESLKKAYELALDKQGSKSVVVWNTGTLKDGEPWGEEITDLAASAEKASETYLPTQTNYSKSVVDTSDPLPTPKKAVLTEITLDEFLSTPPEYTVHSVLLYLEDNQPVVIMDDELCPNWEDILGEAIFDQAQNAEESTFYMRNDAKSIDYTIVYEG